MLHSRSLPTVALVVETSEQCDPGQIERHTQQLAAADIHATWIIACPDQMQRLANQSAGPRAPGWGVRTIQGELPRWAVDGARVQASAWPLAAVICDQPPTKRDLARLQALGVCSIVCNGLGAGSSQRTAEGIWQFGESLSTAGADRLFSRSLVGRLQNHRAGLLVARVDLAATRTARGRVRTDRFVEQLVALQGRQFSVVSLTRATELEESRTMPRPQRSILHAA